MPLRGGSRRLMVNTILNFHFDYWHPSLSCKTRSALYWPLANCDDYPIQQITEKCSIVMCHLPGRFRFRTSRRRLSGSNSRPGGFLQSISLKRGILSLIEPLTHSPDHCSCRFQMFQNQVGIVSYGGECGEEHSPGVYARWKYFQWLLNISSVFCFSGNVSWIMIFLFTI